MIAEFISKLFNKRNCYNYLFFITILLLIGFGTYLRLKFYLANFMLCNDEAAVALNLFQKNYIELFSPLNYGIVCPPFFLVLSKFFLNISGQVYDLYNRDLVLKLIPILSSIAALPLFAILCNKIFKNKLFTITALSILVLNSGIIDYSQEFKQYSFEMLFTVILLIIFYSIDLKKDSFIKIFLYSLIIAISPWCSLPSLFILPAGALIIINELRKEIFNKKNICLFLPIISFILYLIYWFLPEFVIPPQDNSSTLIQYMQDFWTNTNASGFLFNQSNYLENFYHQTKDLMGFTIGNLNIYFLFLIANIFILFSNKNHKLQILIITPIILCLIANYLHLYLYIQRTLLFLLPIYIILYCQVILMIKNKLVMYISTVLFIVYFSIQSLTNNISLYFYNTNSIAADMPTQHTRDIFNNTSLNPTEYLYSLIIYVDPSYVPVYYLTKNKSLYMYIPNEKDVQKNTPIWSFITYTTQDEFKEITNELDILEEYETFVDKELFAELCNKINEDWADRDYLTCTYFNNNNAVNKYAKLFKYKFKSKENLQEQN